MKFSGPTMVEKNVRSAPGAPHPAPWHGESNFLVSAGKRRRSRLFYPPVVGIALVLHRSPDPDGPLAS